MTLKNVHPTLSVNSLYKRPLCHSVSHALRRQSKNRFSFSYSKHILVIQVFRINRLSEVLWFVLRPN
jgi:hypothetical protein